MEDVSCKRLVILNNCFFTVYGARLLLEKNAINDCVSCTQDVDWKYIRRSNYAQFQKGKFIYLKSVSSLPKKFCFICFIESPLKCMKKAFYFILKALSVLKIFKFSSRLFGHVEKTAWLER